MLYYNEHITIYVDAYLPNFSKMPISSRIVIRMRTTTKIVNGIWEDTKGRKSARPTEGCQAPTPETEEKHQSAVKRSELFVMYTYYAIETLQELGAGHLCRLSNSKNCSDVQCRRNRRLGLK